MLLAWVSAACGADGETKPAVPGADVAASGTASASGTADVPGGPGEARSVGEPRSSRVLGTGPGPWSHWRGPLATGLAPDANPPIEWGPDRNVRFKTPIPGRGHSSPIVVGERVFLLTAIPVGEPLEPRWSGRPGAHDNLPVTSEQAFAVVGVDRRSGEILFETVVHEEIPLEGGHDTGSLASASPVSDGELLIAFFGSFGLYALDLDGNVLWSRDLGQMHTKHGHGEGASPLLVNGRVVVNWDHEGESFLAVFDAESGEPAWRVARDEVSSWASPIAVENEGRIQIVVAGTKRMRAYDLENGEVIWECGGLASNICATPVFGEGIVVAGSSYERKAMFAVRLDGARGDVTGTERHIWRRTRGTPYVPSPLLYDESLYFLAHYQNVLSRARLRTGENDGGPVRLSALRNIYASPVGAAGRIYVTDVEGTTVVLSHEREPKVLATNRLDDPISASGALAGRDLFLRSERFLYAISESQGSE